MTSRHVFAASLLMSIGLVLLPTGTLAHDAFYPHHREDFEAVTRRRELRGPVLIITAGFLVVLAGVFYTALRKSAEVDRSHHKDIQADLKGASDEAARAAHAVLTAHGNVADAIQGALAAYAESSGVTWKANPVTAGGNALRCKIGADVIIVKISEQPEAYYVEVDASREDLRAKSVVSIARDSMRP